MTVVGLHLCNLFHPGPQANPFHHGHLAVDFFFMLSGFVVGHAYDRRWGRMSLSGFFARRLVRLHPLLLLGAAIGAVTYLGEIGMQGLPFWPSRFIENLVLIALCLPARGLPGHFGMTHALNQPTWSLTQEYAANVAYALVGRRLGRGALTLLVAVFAVAELGMALVHGDVDTGWAWYNVVWTPVRTAFPFAAGLLLQRSGVRFNARVGWVGLSLVLVAAFAAPLFPVLGGVRTNGLFEAALIIGAFPLIIAAGAASEPRGISARVCRISGEVSYPLYITHAPLVQFYGIWMQAHHLPHDLAVGIAAALGLALPLVAWGAFKLYDEPVRAWLSRGLGERRVPGEAPVGAPAAQPASD
jgi:peptidoglycan/LPS O-acetylase OafA/YrhL